MAETSTDALAFLKRPPHKIGPVAVVHGTDLYLKREVLRAIRDVVGAGNEDGVAAHTLEGAGARLSDVLDELSTVSLFGSQTRLVFVEEADKFVTEHRAALERYVENPAKNGILVLDVKSWRADTRLAKAAAAAGGVAVRCDPPKLPQLRSRLELRAKQLQVTLNRDALDLLLESVPQELGVLEQELTKLAACVGDGGAITAAVVQENTAGGRVRQTWDMIDAAARGDAREALRQLDRLVSAGEDPAGILPQLAGVLRRFVTAGRLVELAEADGRRPNLRAALQETGIPAFKLGEAEGQLRQLGRQRIGRLLHWLLEVDLALKGSHSRPEQARRKLETLIVRLSKAADARVQASSQPR